MVGSVAPVPRLLPKRLWISAASGAFVFFLGLAQSVSYAQPSRDGGAFGNLPAVLPDGSGPEAIFEAMRFCGGRADRNARLDCYDQIGAYLNRVFGARAEQEYTWGVQVGNEGGRPHAMIAIDAAATGSEDDVSGSMTGRVTLTARCKDEKTSVYATFDRPVAGDEEPILPMQVGYGFNRDEQQGWEVSRSGRSVGFWRDEGAAKSLLQRLLTAPSLRLAARGPDGKRISATFTLSGYPAALAHIREACRW